MIITRHRKLFRANHYRSHIRGPVTQLEQIFLFPSKYLYQSFNSPVYTRQGGMPVYPFVLHQRISVTEAFCVVIMEKMIIPGQPYHISTEIRYLGERYFCIKDGCNQPYSVHHRPKIKVLFRKL